MTMTPEKRLELLKQIAQFVPQLIFELNKFIEKRLEEQFGKDRDPILDPIVSTDAVLALAKVYLESLPPQKARLAFSQYVISVVAALDNSEKQADAEKASPSTKTSASQADAPTDLDECLTIKIPGTIH